MLTKMQLTNGHFVLKLEDRFTGPEWRSEDIDLFLEECTGHTPGAILKWWSQRILKSLEEEGDTTIKTNVGWVFSEFVSEDDGVVLTSHSGARTYELTVSASYDLAVVHEGRALTLATNLNQVQALRLKQLHEHFFKSFVGESDRYLGDPVKWPIPTFHGEGDWPEAWEMED